MVLLAAACDGPALDLDAGAAREDLVDGLGRSTAQIVQQSVIGGDLGWHYHTGGHMATPADWSAFLQFLAKYFKA